MHDFIFSCLPMQALKHAVSLLYRFLHLLLTFVLIPDPQSSNERCTVSPRLLSTSAPGWSVVCGITCPSAHDPFGATSAEDLSTSFYLFSTKRKTFLSPDPYFGLAVVPDLPPILHCFTLERATCFPFLKTPSQNALVTLEGRPKCRFVALVGRLARFLGEMQ